MERAGFADFVAAHGRRLLHLAELLTGDQHLAEDLTQDVLARAYLHWDRIRRDDPYTYLRRSLVNARTDRWRRRLPIPMADPGSKIRMPDHAQELVDRDLVLTALRRLTARERGVIALRYYEDLTEAQTAEHLGVAVGTVKSANARALTKLRENPALHDLWIEELR